jgi:hypothetical protein
MNKYGKNVKQEQDRQQLSAHLAANGETADNNSNNDNNNKQVIMPLNARKSVATGPNGHSMIVKNKAFKLKLMKNTRKSIMTNSSVKPKQEPEDKTSINNNEISDKSDTDAVVSEAQSGAPCSMHCPGRRGMLPNLMCSRCFCLYHLDCVPGGVFLEEPRVFVCPVSNK